MLYRYPIEQKKTAQETVSDNRRYDNYTGEVLPPIPYIDKNQGGTAPKTKGTVSRGTTATGGQAATDNAQMRRQQQINAISTLWDREKSYLGSNYNAQKKQAQDDNEDAMRSLYIAYMQGIRNMPQQTALWGAGGEIESLKAQQRMNYENNRAKQTREYSGVLNDIQQRYNSDLWELEQKYLKQLLSL